MQTNTIQAARPANNLKVENKMTKAINLITASVYEFDNKTVPAYAVAYAYCTDNNRTSELFYHVHNFSLDSLYDKLPMHYGNFSVACGDWVCKL